MWGESSEDSLAQLAQDDPEIKRFIEDKRSAIDQLRPFAKNLRDQFEGHSTSVIVHGLLNVAAELAIEEKAPKVGLKETLDWLWFCAKGTIRQYLPSQENVTKQ